MRKLMVFALLMAAGLTGGGYAQEVPVEVKRFLENYLKDSTHQRGPLRYKPASVPMKDLRLRVLQIYRFKNISLEKYPDTVALSEVIEPSGFWRVGVIAHGKLLYEVTLDNETGKPRITIIRSGFPSDRPHPLWDPLLKTYPESTEINPVLLIAPCRTYPFHEFLYFKQKDPRKIYYAGNGNFPFDSIFTASIEVLDDSRKLIEYKKWLDTFRAEERMRQSKTKVVGDDEDDKPKETFSPSNKLEVKGSGDFKDIVIPSNY